MHARSVAIINAPRQRCASTEAVGRGRLAHLPLPLVDCESCDVFFLIPGPETPLPARRVDPVAVGSLLDAQPECASGLALQEIEKGSFRVALPHPTLKGITSSLNAPVALLCREWRKARGQLCLHAGWPAPLPRRPPRTPWVRLPRCQAVAGCAQSRRAGGHTEAELTKSERGCGARMTIWVSKQSLDAASLG